MIVFLVGLWTLPTFPRALEQLINIFLLVPSVLILRRIVEPAVWVIQNPHLKLGSEKSSPHW